MPIRMLLSALIGVLAGLGADALLRDRDPRSRAVIATSTVSGMLGYMVAARAPQSPLVPTLVALASALVGAFVVRAAVSARMERAARSHLRAPVGVSG